MSRSSVRSVSVPALAAVLAAALPAALAEAGNGSIRALNFDFQAGRFYPKTVSDDGSVAAGRWINYIDNRYLGARFSVPSNELLVVGDDGLNTGCGVMAANGDGTRLAGYVEGPKSMYAFRMVGSVMENLGSLPGDPEGSSGYWANGMDGTGDVVVGWSGGSGISQRSFRWTQATGMVELLPPVIESASIQELAAIAVSGDGSTAFGRFRGYYPAKGMPIPNVAVRWTNDGPAELLGRPLGWSESWAVSSSTDGSVIVGGGLGELGSYAAFRWSAAGGMVDLGTLPGGYSTIPEAISGDGSMIVGSCGVGQWFKAFVWTQATGMVSLADFLASRGISTQGFPVLSEVTDISSNGRFMVGSYRLGCDEFGVCDRPFIVDLGDPASACPADLNGDGNVAGFDLGMLLANWEGQGTGDLDQSGFVNGADLGLLLSAWGPCSGG